MKSLVLLVLLTVCLGISSYAQSHPSFHINGRMGTQFDIPESEVVFGGGLGLGLDFGSSESSWQFGLQIDKYSNQSISELNYHGYKNWSAMLNFGRIWTSGIQLAKQKVRFGGGAVLVSTLKLREAPGGNKTVSSPSLGLYLRADYPVYLSQNGELRLFLDNSVFGDGFMRNNIGISYLLGSKSK